MRCFLAIWLSNNLKRLVFILSTPRRGGDAVRSLKRLDLLPLCPVFNIVPQDGWMSSPPPLLPPPSPHPLYKFSKIYFSPGGKGRKWGLLPKTYQYVEEKISSYIRKFVRKGFSSRMRNRVQRIWIFLEIGEPRPLDGCKIDIKDTFTKYIFWFVEPFLCVLLRSLKKVRIWPKTFWPLKHTKRIEKRRKTFFYDRISELIRQSLKSLYP